MKRFIYSFAALLIVLCVVLVVFSIATRKQPELGLLNGQLQPCPDSPNCVCSEYPNKDAYVEPLAYTDSAEVAWSRIKQVVAETGGVVIAEEPGYLRAVYET